MLAERDVREASGRPVLNFLQLTAGGCYELRERQAAIEVTLGYGHDEAQVAHNHAVLRASRGGNLDGEVGAVLRQRLGQLVV